MVKVKARWTMDCVVDGYLGPADHPMSLLLGVDEGGILRHIEQTHQLKHHDLAALLRVLDQLTTGRSFERGTPDFSGWENFRYQEWTPLRPLLVCEVAYTAVSYGMLRRVATFVRWRPDKRPEQCLDVL